MIRADASDNWEEWYDLNKGGDKLFAETYDLLTELAKPDGTDEQRHAKWAHIKMLIYYFKTTLHT